MPRPAPLSLVPAARLRIAARGESYRREAAAIPGDRHIARRWGVVDALLLSRMRGDEERRLPG
jgi:hypothetical protein